MTKGKSVSKLVYAYDPSQLPKPGSKSDIKIKVVNQHHLFVMDLSADRQHDFKLNVIEPDLLGLVRFEDGNVNEFMRRTIMACNLTLVRAVLATNSVDSAHARIDMGRLSQHVPKIEKTSDGTKITIKEVIRIRDSVSLAVGFIDELDETQALDTLQKIQTVFNYGNNSTLKIHNLQKSLNAYLRGTNATDIFLVFRSLYESLELATNLDKPRRKDADFDVEVKRIMSDQAVPVKDLRRLNNRIKHADENEQRAYYETSTANISQHICTLRPVVTTVILHRLNQM